MMANGGLSARPADRDTGSVILERRPVDSDKRYVGCQEGSWKRSILRLTGLAARLLIGR